MTENSANSVSIQLTTDEAVHLVCMLMAQAREESEWRDALPLLRQAFEMVRAHLPELSDLASSRNADAVGIARQGFESEAITQILGAMEGIRPLPEQRRSLYRAIVAISRGRHLESINRLAEAMQTTEFSEDQLACIYWAIECLECAIESVAILDNTYDVRVHANAVQAQIDAEIALRAETAARRAAELATKLPPTASFASILPPDDGAEDAEEVDASEAVRVIVTDQGEMLPSFVTESGIEVPLVEYLAERDIFAKMVEEGDETIVFPAAFVDLLAQEEEQPEVDSAFDLLLKPDATSEQPLEVEEMEIVAPAFEATRSVPPPPPSRKSCASLPPPLPVYTSTEEAQFFEEGERITRRSSPRLLAFS